MTEHADIPPDIANRAARLMVTTGMAEGYAAAEYLDYEDLDSEYLILVGLLLKSAINVPLLLGDEDMEPLEVAKDARSVLVDFVDILEHLLEMYPDDSSFAKEFVHFLHVQDGMAVWDPSILGKFLHEKAIKNIFGINLDLNADPHQE